MNGVEMVGVGEDWVVSLDVLFVDLLGIIEVLKLLIFDQNFNLIGGIVNVKVILVFDCGKEMFNLKIQDVYNELCEFYFFCFSLNGIEFLMGDKIGIGYVFFYEDCEMLIDEICYYSINEMKFYCVDFLLIDEDIVVDNFGLEILGFV